MKKQILIFLIVSMSFMSGACSGGDGNSGSLVNAENDTALVNDPSGSKIDQIKTNMMNITIGDKVLTATLADNSSAAALIDALSEGPIKVDMRDYGNMEKVGSLGRDFPRNDERITTEPGDIILFQGSALVIYYAPNTWSFTKLGKIDNVTQEELKDILGEGNVIVTLSLPLK